MLKHNQINENQNEARDYLNNMTGVPEINGGREIYKKNLNTKEG